MKSFSLRSIALVLVAVFALAGTGYAATTGVTGWSAAKSTVAPAGKAKPKTRVVKRRVCEAGKGCQVITIKQQRVCSKVTVTQKRNGKKVKQRVTDCKWVAVKKS